MKWKDHVSQKPCQTAGPVGARQLYPRFCGRDSENRFPLTQTTRQSTKSNLIRLVSPVPLIFNPRAFSKIFSVKNELSGSVGWSYWLLCVFSVCTQFVCCSIREGTCRTQHVPRLQHTCCSPVWSALVGTNVQRHLLSILQSSSQTSPKAAEQSQYRLNFRTFFAQSIVPATNSSGWTKQNCGAPRHSFRRDCVMPFSVSPIDFHGENTYHTHCRLSYQHVYLTSRNKAAFVTICWQLHL